MKKLLYSFALILAIAGTVLCQVPPPGYPNVFYNMWSTNILVSDAIRTNKLSPGTITLSSSPVGASPTIRFVGPSSLGTIKLNDALANTINMTTDVRISGDLDVAGTVTGSAIVYSLTNITYATNSINATNDQWGNTLLGTNGIYADTNLYKLAQSYYPTNAAATNTDMRVPYGDVMWETGFYWPQVLGASLSTDNYQTAVRILHATNAPAGGTNFGWDNRIRTYGSLRITNETICTFFYNPSSGTTNLFSLPVW